METRSTVRREVGWLILAGLIALVHGLFYVLLLPPWQHYDEPNHFEIVWLTAHNGHIPQPTDYDPKFSRQVFRSMLENGFFNYLGEAAPQLEPPSEKVHIPGYPQFGEPPLYYWLASLPVRFLASSSLNVQLHAARLVSLALFLLVIAAGWGVAREVFPPGHPARWLVPLTLALLPAFTDLMTAVNNDAAAIAVFSWFFWGCVRCLRRLTLFNLVWLIGMAGLAYWAKNTALLAWGLAPVVILFAILRGRWRWLAWALASLALVGGLLASLSLDDARAWYRATSQPGGTRLEGSQAVLGGSVLHLDPAADVVPDWSPPLFQALPPQTAQALFGKAVTLGVWMWASQPVTADSPRLIAATQSFSETVSLSQAPQFFSFQVTLPPGRDRVWVYLDPRPRDSGPLDSGPRDIYYDGLVLAAGQYPTSDPPQFENDQGLSGTWGGQAFQNLLRNPSGEQAAFRVRSWLDNPASFVLPNNARPSLVLASLQDLSGSAYFYRLTLAHLFQTFWARFSWGHVPLIGASFWYPALWVLTGLAGLGCILGCWRLRGRLPGALILVAGLALLAAWGMALTRGVVYLSLPAYYVPTARHAYPVILPAVMGLVFGWVELWRAAITGVRRIQGGPNEPAASVDLYRSGLWRTGAVVYAILFLILDAWSIYSVARFYTG